MTRPYHEESYNYPKVLSFNPNNHKQSHTDNKIWNRCCANDIIMKSWSSHVTLTIQAYYWYHSCDSYQLIRELGSRTCDIWWHKLTNSIIHLIPISQSGSEINSGHRHVIGRSHGISYCRNCINRAPSGPQKLTYFYLRVLYYWALYSIKLVTLILYYLVLVTWTSTT